MAERLQIIISAKDQFSKAFAKLQGRSAQLKQFGIIGAAALGSISAASVALGSKFIKMASDMEETTNKFNVVFRDQIATANQWADEISEGFFTSREEARRFLASVQDLLVPMGMNSKAAGELSNRIVRLSADLGSFNNLPTERVISDIQSALVGNYETVKKYGVVLTATAVKQRALNDGLAKSEDELTTADKALTAYKIILESSQAAVGDMARSSESWANQSKRLYARLTDVGTEIGQVLLRVATQYLIKLNNWVEANRDLIVQRTADWLRNVALMMIEVGKGLKWIDDNLTDKVIQFLFRSKELSRFEILTKGLKDMQARLRELRAEAEMSTAISFGEPPQELQNKIKLLEDMIKIRKQEIEQLQKRNEVLSDTPQIKMFTEFKPIMPMEKLPLPGYDDKNIKALDEQIKAYIESQKTAQIEYYDFLAGLDDEYNAEQLERRRESMQAVANLRTEYLGTEFEQLAAWYEQELEQYGQFQENKAVIDEIYADRKAELDKAMQQKRQAMQDKALSDTITSMKAFGKEGFALAKTFEVAQALIAAHRAFVNTLATASEYFLPPIPQVMAGAALAAGLAHVATISATKYGGAAHGGLDYVPKEQTYLLDRGERVVSPSQNRDLTEFLKRTENGMAGIQVNNLNVNVTAPVAYEQMKKKEWYDIGENYIVPALRELSKRGIKA